VITVAVGAATGIAVALLLIGGRMHRYARVRHEYRSRFPSNGAAKRRAVLLALVLLLSACASAAPAPTPAVPEPPDTTSADPGGVRAGAIHLHQR
jgi:hypothetical protein